MREERAGQREQKPDKQDAQTCNTHATHTHTDTNRQTTYTHTKAIDTHTDACTHMHTHTHTHTHMFISIIHRGPDEEAVKEADSTLVLFKVDRF